MEEPVAAKFILDQGRNETDWEPLLFSGEGLFGAPRLLSGGNGSNKASVKVTLGDVTLIFKSASSNLRVVDGVLTQGTVTAIDLKFDGDKVFHLTGLSVAASAVRSLLNNGAEDGRDARFVAVFSNAPMTFSNLSEGPATFFGSSRKDSFTFTAADDPNDINYAWTGGGADTVKGSSTFDFADYGAATKALNVSFANGTVIDVNGKSYGTFDRKVEAVGGSRFGDTMTGDGRANVIFGNGGQDTLKGNGGNDYFSGGGNHDTIFGNGGFDTLGYERDGDAQQGIVLVYDAGSSLSGQATDTYGKTDVFSGIESVIGSFLGDSIEGNDAVNRFEGRGGDDTLTGGGNADQFVIGVLDSGSDTLMDFAPGVDKILLSGSSFDSGPLGGTFFLAAAGVEADTSERHVLYDTATGELFFDFDGNGEDDPVLLATLTGAPSLNFTDIEMI
jgi:Ca2+-binding RTX toxin-like protein